ncbi:cation:proton antiporter [Flexithrix dorotheae]|uniref:cation:proton antiporter domain-containing protein n=1 Tax=Flexithrix dorotheae TaxID=70993 RepID=UPI00037DA196|nr:cation:proton antiporter [Flexithrix dorotheae]
MVVDNSYLLVISVCVIIILSYIFNQVAKKTNVPSVLMLIALGVGIKEALKYFNISLGNHVFDILEIIGIVGLIMIVLEAALDLELKKEKAPLIIKSFLVAFFALIVSSGCIAYIIHRVLLYDIFISLLYAVPLSIMSSAIIIPSVGSLVDSKKEFLIYESTFSDILGIMVFYFLLGSTEASGTGSIVVGIVVNILATVVLSVVASYAIVLLFQRMESQVKLFLLIAVLVLLYAVGKMFHLSSLVIILVFGLLLNNYKVFFKGKLKSLLKESALKLVIHELHIVTFETAFIVRTFFFVIFGITLDLLSLLDVQTALISLSIVATLFVIRFLMLKIFGNKSILPELFVAPRGLITILLFFAIPIEFQQESFSSGILLFTILLTSLIMTMGLIFKGRESEYVEELNFTDWEELDKEIKVVSAKNMEETT